MKKFLSLPLMLVMFCAFAKAQTYDQFYQNMPFQMDKVIQPKFPNNTVLLTDFNAVSDGITSNTKAFADAIEALSKQGGGRLVVPRGSWCTGPIHFKDNINLHLETGAFIVFTSNLDEYPLVEAIYEGARARRAMSPINAHKLTNIAITGNGIIDGNGFMWRPVKKEKMTDRQWRNLVASGGALEDGRIWHPSQETLDVFQNKLKDPKTPEEINGVKFFNRPVMLSFVECKYILLQGVTFQNSPAWNLHPLMCEHLTIDGINVRNPWYSQNGDGLDIESCSHVLLVNSTFDVGDDAICVKSGRDKQGRDRGMPTQNLIVDNCVVYHGHGGFVVGSEMSGGARNILVRNCTFIGTNIGLRFKSTRGRGGVVENIFIENIDMRDIPNEALLFDLYYATGGTRTEVVPPVTEETPTFRNIHIKNVVSVNAGTSIFFNGLPEMNVKNVTLENIRMTDKKGAIIRQTDGLSFKNSVIVPQTGEAILIEDSKNIDTAGLRK